MFKALLHNFIIGMSNIQTKDRSRVTKGLHLQVLIIVVKANIQCLVRNIFFPVLHQAFVEIEFTFILYDVGKVTSVQKLRQNKGILVKWRVNFRISFFWLHHLKIFF